MDALGECLEKGAGKEGNEGKLTPPPKPGTPRGLPCGTPGHTAVEAHVHLLWERVEDWQTGSGAGEGEKVEVGIEKDGEDVVLQVV